MQEMSSNPIPAARKEVLPPASAHTPTSDMREQVYTLVSTIVDGFNQSLTGGEFPCSETTQQIQALRPGQDCDKLRTLTVSELIDELHPLVNLATLPLGYAAGFHFSSTHCQPLLARFNPQELEEVTVEPGVQGWIADAVMLQGPPGQMALALDRMVFVDNEAGRENAREALNAMYRNFGRTAAKLFPGAHAEEHFSKLVEELGPQRLRYEELSHVADNAFLARHASFAPGRQRDLYRSDSSVLSELDMHGEFLVAETAGWEYAAHLRGVVRHLQELEQRDPAIGCQMALTYALSWNSAEHEISRAPEYRLLASLLRSSYERLFNVGPLAAATTVAAHLAQDLITPAEGLTRILARFEQLALTELAPR